MDTTTNDTNDTNGYTFIVKTVDLDPKYMKAALLERGWTETTNSKETTFMFLDDKYVYDNTLYDIKSDIKNIVHTDKLSICDKNKLYDNFKSYNPKLANKFMVEQHFVNIDNYEDPLFKKLFEKNKIWIIKPIASFLGIGIQVFTNYNDFINYFRETSKKTNLTKQERNFLKTGYVLAKYINKPLLYLGKKFHLRVYFMYDATNKKGYIFKKSKLTVAKKDYITDNYNDQEIHDTHCLIDICGFVFPKDFLDQYDNKVAGIIFEQLKVLFYHVLQLINAGCFSESKKCFEIFGADVMIDSNLKIVLLEINDKIGFHDYNKKQVIQLNKDIMDGVLTTMIDPLYKPISSYTSTDKSSDYVVDITDYCKDMDPYFYKYLKYKIKYIAKHYAKTNSS